MKKAKSRDKKMRAEYRLEGTGPLVQGKYANANAYVKATNLVVIGLSLTSA